MKRVCSLIGAVIVLFCALMPIMSYADYEGVTSEVGLGQTRYYYVHPYRRIGISVSNALNSAKYYWMPDILYFTNVGDSVLLYSDVMCSIYVDLKEDSDGKYAEFSIIPDPSNTSVWTLDLEAELSGLYPSNLANNGVEDRFTLTGSFRYTLITYELYDNRPIYDTDYSPPQPVFGYTPRIETNTVNTASIGLLPEIGQYGVLNREYFGEDDLGNGLFLPLDTPVGLRGMYSIHGAFPAQLSYTFTMRVTSSVPSHELYAAYSMLYMTPEHYRALINVIDDSEAFTDIGGFLDTSIGGFFDMQIFPHVTIGGVFFVILGVLLVVVFLRLFAGG